VSEHYYMNLVNCLKPFTT